jgi:hypothetical protein
MRRSLGWALAASVALSAVAVWLPGAAPPAVPAIDRSESSAIAPSAQASLGMASRSLKSLPATLPAWSIDLARRDPFVPYTSAPPPVPDAPPPAEKPPPPPPAPEPGPTAPEVAYRFLGRMLTPDGQTITLLGRDAQSIEIKLGLVLEDGYKVESITDQAVRLIYPPLGTVVEIPIPRSNPR